MTIYLNIYLKMIETSFFTINFYCKFWSVAGGEAGGSSPPGIFRFELNSATKVEFRLLTWTAIDGSYSFQVLSIIARLSTVVLLCNLELCKGTKSYFCSAENNQQL